MIVKERKVRVLIYKQNFELCYFQKQQMILNGKLLENVMLVNQQFLESIKN